MAETKIIALLLLLSGAVSCVGTAPTYSWQALDIDAHRTGVSAPLADNIPQALGCVDGKSYTAPNGRAFKEGSTPAVAELMIKAQPSMARLKEVIAYSDEEMTKYRPESELSNFAVDLLKVQTEKLTGRKVDVSILNFGGIRTNMPAGPVILDDIVSMFPFKNYVCYVSLPGAELRRIFEQMAATRVEAIGGARLVIKDGKLVSATVGGRPISDFGTYGLATIDFLIDGGDGLKLAKNCKELITTDVKLIDAVEPYIRELNAKGETLKAALDGRVTILD